MDVDDYEEITRKPLKIRKEKSKKKGSDKSRNPTTSQPEDRSRDLKVIVSSSTKAEQAFKARQEKKAQERILKKASKTHKQRVEEFNKHLDSLSEHYDIPKVSWTK